jgi:peptidoglycan hydrolase-like protein with peptidoglycan-binding domain
MCGYLKPSPRSQIKGIFASLAMVMLASSAGFAQQSGFPVPNQAAPATPTTETINRPILRSGSKGNEVSELQATLKLLGFYSGSVDGVYGQTTVSAVSSFQQAAGLDADGITGPATWGKLFPLAPLAEADPLPPSSPTAALPPSSAVPVPAATRPATPVPTSSPAVTAAVKQPAASGTTGTAQPTAPELTFPVLRVGMRGPAVIGLQNRLRSIGVLKSGADGVFGPETQEAVRAAQRKFKLEADGVVGPATWRELLQ